MESRGFDCKSKGSQAGRICWCNSGNNNNDNNNNEWMVKRILTLKTFFPGTMRIMRQSGFSWELEIVDESRWKIPLWWTEVRAAAGFSTSWREAQRQSPWLQPLSALNHRKWVCILPFWIWREKIYLPRATSWRKTQIREGSRLWKTAQFPKGNLMMGMEGKLSGLKSGFRMKEWTRQRKTTMMHGQSRLSGGEYCVLERRNN